MVQRDLFQEILGKVFAGPFRSVLCNVMQKLCFLKKGQHMPAGGRAMWGPRSGAKATKSKTSWIFLQKNRSFLNEEVFKTGDLCQHPPTTGVGSR